MSKLAQEVML